MTTEGMRVGGREEAFSRTSELLAPLNTDSNIEKHLASYIKGFSARVRRIFAFQTANATNSTAEDGMATMRG